MYVFAFCVTGSSGNQAAAKGPFAFGANPGTQLLLVSLHRMVPVALDVMLGFKE